MTKKVTVRTVAGAAGVSIATVSRVMNNDLRVFGTTRDHVLKTARELRYIPLSKTKKYSIAIIFHKDMNRYHQIMIPYLTNAAIRKQWQCEWISVDDIDLLNHRAFSGALAILDHTQLGNHWKKEQNIPLVWVGGKKITPGDNVHWIRTDLYPIVLKKLRQLNSRGHRNIMYVGGFNRKEEESYSTQSFPAFVQYCKEQGIDDVEKYCCFNLSKKVPDFRELINKGCTALFVSGETWGLVVSQALLMQNIKVPEELSVLCMENPNISEFLCPPSTTIAKNYDHLAENAVDFLDELMNGRTNDHERTVSGYFINRKSIAPPGISTD